MLHRITDGTVLIEYEVLYSKRKTLAIQVHPDSRVIVRAPLGTSMTIIEPFVLQRATWVQKHQLRFRENPILMPSRRCYADGEIYYYLGHKYHLRIVQAVKEGVQLEEESLVVRVANLTESSRIVLLIDRWYRKEAKQVFADRLAACFPMVEWMGVEYPAMTIRDMKSRWGSCSARQKISLNLKLIQVAEELIDYVILHELCHLKELNHSPAFYGLMDKILPDWRELRKRLNQSPVSI